MESSCLMFLFAIWLRDPENYGKLSNIFYFSWDGIFKVLMTITRSISWCQRYFYENFSWGKTSVRGDLNKEVVHFIHTKYLQTKFITHYFENLELKTCSRTCTWLTMNHDNRQKSYLYLHIRYVILCVIKVSGKPVLMNNLKLIGKIPDIDLLEFFETKLC